MNARGFARPGLLTLGLAFSAAVACGGDGLLAATDGVAVAAPSIDGDIASGSPTQYMGGGCERVRRPSCNRRGRRSTHR